MSNPKFVFTVAACSLGAFCLVLIGVGQLLSDQWTVETTRIVNAPVTRTAPMLRDFALWQEWSAIDFRLGQPTRRSIEGEPGTVGHRWVWQGPIGSATMTTTRAEDQLHAFEIEYRFADNGQRYGGRLTGAISWRAVGDRTEVKISEHNRVERLLDRWALWFGALQEKVRQVQGSSLNGLEKYLRDHAADPGK